MTEQPLRVMTFNILRQEWSREGDPSWEQRKPGALAVLAEVKPDILGLQEETQDQLDDLLTAFPQLQLAGSRPLMGGSIVFRRDKFEMDQSGLIKVAQKMARSGNRSIQWALLRRTDTGRRILFYNTHPSPFDEPDRVEASEQLLQHARTFPASHDCLIVVGDLNASEANESIQLLLESERPRLRSAWREFHGFKDISETARLVARAKDAGQRLDDAENAGITLSMTDREQIEADLVAAGPGSFHGYKPRVRPGPIDYILIPPHVTVVEARILTGLYNGVFPSDHFPVWADLMLQTAAH